MSRKMLVILSVLFVFICTTCIVGYIAFKKFSRSSSGATRSEAFKSGPIKEVGSIRSDFINENTVIEKQLNYKAGIPVVLKLNESAGKEIIGMDKISATDYFKQQGFLLLDYSTKRVTIEKDINAWPPNYYIVKIVDGKIKLYETDKNSVLTYKSDYNMDIEQLPVGDVNTLKKGRAFGSLDLIDDMFADYES